MCIKDSLNSPLVLQCSASVGISSKLKNGEPEFQVGFCVLLWQKLKLFMFGIKRVDDAVDFSA